jgi:ABC-type dipeptide/oligopeptide/nickel transport system permease subunit
MKNKLFGMLGAAILTGISLVALCAPVIAPYSPYQQSARPYQRPDSAHFLGANDIGQDIFSELLYGARNSLLVGIFSAFIAMTIAIFVGVFAGWYGGPLGSVLMQITAFFLTLPFIPAVIILAAFMRGGLLTMALILGCLSWPGLARLLYAAVIEIKERAYIKMLRGMGAGGGYIITRHVLRELLPLLLYHAVMRLKSGILAESSMSFLGLGNPAAKSWGAMLYYAQSKNALLTGAWVWWVIPPGLCICLVSMSLMMVAYYLEEKSDKRMERKA